MKKNSTIIKQQFKALVRKQLSLAWNQKCALFCQIFFPFFGMTLFFLLGLGTSAIHGSVAPFFPLGLNNFSRNDQPKALNHTLHTGRFLFEQIPNRYFSIYSKDEKINALIGTLLPDGTSSGMLNSVEQYQFRGNKTSQFAPHEYVEQGMREKKKFYSSEEFDLWFVQNVRNQSRHILQGLIGAANIQQLSLEKNELVHEVLHGTDVSSYCFGTDCKGSLKSWMITIVHNAFFEKILGVSLTTSTQKVPHWSYPPVVVEQLIESPKSGFFLFAMFLLFPLPVFMYTMVLEKTQKLREMMKLMGMKMWIYWVVTFGWNLLIYILNFLIVLIVSWVYGYKWIQASPVILLLFFISWGLALISFSFFLSAFIRSPLWAVILGFLIALVEPIFGAMMGIWLIPNNYSVAWIWSLLIMPIPLHHVWDNGILYACQSYKGCPDIYALGSWNSITRGIVFLFLNSIIYLLLGIYLDGVLPQPWGVRKNIFFCFTQCCRRKKKKNEKTSLFSKKKNEEDEDVAEERKYVETELIDTTTDRVVIKNLNKKYGTKDAIWDLCLTVKNGECLGLLGPNGAGKSTLISILCGLHEPSNGTASINGFDISTDAKNSRLNIGLCPQHSVLWPSLTVLEHLLFYARLKGVDASEQKKHVNEILTSVGLEEKKNSASKNLSGGMQRRLALAISFIGYPTVVLLDEPTTGLDPTSKRQIWDIIAKEKQNKSIILTTHSLEEADLLTDKIGIMSMGKLISYGSSFHLKSKFGEGYQITLNYEQKDEKSVLEYVSKFLPTARLFREFYEQSTFLISKGSMKVSNICVSIEENKKEYKIKSWAFSQTTLEDVFLKLVENDESLTN